MKPKKKVLIAIPMNSHFDVISKHLFFSYVESYEYMMQNVDQLPFEPLFELYTPSTVPLSANRNQCVGYAQKHKFDSIVWIDADHKLRRDNLLRLLRDGYDYPIYAGVYHLKRDTQHPIIFTAKDEDFEVFYPIWRMPLEELFYADMIGMGCVKIDIEVYNNLHRPYYQYNKIPEALKDLNEDMKFKYEYGVEDVSEDVYFWKKVSKTPYKVVVDPKIKMGHLVVKSIESEDVFEKAKLNKKVQRVQYQKEYPDGNFEKKWDEIAPKPKLVRKVKSVDWII